MQGVEDIIINEERVLDPEKISLHPKMERFLLSFKYQFLCSYFNLSWWGTPNQNLMH